MRILVTGSNGFIGKHLVRGLEAAEHDVEGYDWPFNVAELGEVREFDAVVNLAAIGGAGRAARSPREVMVNNVACAASLRGALRPWEGYWPRCIHVSSFSVYGAAKVPTTEDAPLAPLEVYGASKAAQELAWTGYPGPLTILRLSSVYGPGMRLDDPESTVIAKIAKAARAHEVFEVFEDGKQTRDFVHVLDVVDTIKAALSSRLVDVGVHLVNVCSGRPTSIIEACKALGAEYKLSGKSRPGDMRACLGSCERMKALLGRDPRAFTPKDILG